MKDNQENKLLVDGRRLYEEIEKERLWRELEQLSLYGDISKAFPEAYNSIQDNSHWGMKAFTFMYMSVGVGLGVGTLVTLVIAGISILPFGK